MGLWQFPIFKIMEEFIFYYSHSMLHHKYFYKRIHKQHHEWTAPIALAANYAHPIELAFSNAGPAALALVVLRPHFLSFLNFSSLGILITLADHSGYELVETGCF